MQKLFSGLCLLLIAVSAGIVMAQDTPESTDTPPALVGPTWQWTRFTNPQQATDVLSPNYTIAFADDGTFSALADCNHVSGTYTADESSLSILSGPMTLMACPPGSLDSQFMAYLSQVSIYSFTDDGDLLLEMPADSGTMRFVAQAQVTGTVSYMLRIALPDNAVVRVQIQDVSLADAPSLIIGEQVIPTAGAQVPIPFAVSYPESAIQDGHTYSLAARITDGEGRLLFISDTIVPVITDDNPTSDIEMILVPVGS